MTDQDFDFIRELVRRQCALVIEDSKRYLVETRLSPLVREQSLGSITDLVAKMRAPASSGLHTKVVEAMVTTETSFFRDIHPFEVIKKTLLPELIERRANERRLRLWCAASSSGQEPYSLALLLRESFPQLVNWDVTILATDVSREMVARTREGRFTQLEVNRGLPAALLVKYFTQQGVHWQLNDDVRKSVEVREMNLARPWPVLPPMDLVLMRNVLIYFDVQTKKEILGRLGRVLRLDGYLLLGGAETTFAVDETYRRVDGLKTGVYQRGT